MFGIGSTELLIIVVVALIVIGPQKLPQMMRSLGKGMAEFKRMSSDVTDTLDKEIKSAEKSLREQELSAKLAAEEAARKKAEAVLAEKEAAGAAAAPDAAEEPEVKVAEEPEVKVAEVQEGDTPEEAVKAEA